MRWWLTAWVAIALIATSSCDESGDDAPGEAEGGTAVDGPASSLPTDIDDTPSGPGLEPPATGAAGSGAGQPTPGAGDGTDPGVRGDGDAMEPGNGAALDADAGFEDPCSAPVCGVETPCADAPDVHCVALPSCGGARCVSPGQACALECDPEQNGSQDAAGCALAESYPEQVVCP
jgi:hypothetical protein